MLHSRPPTQNFFPGTIYSSEIFVGDPYTFLFVKRGILQFVYVKPVLAIITMVLKATGNYHEGEFTLKSAYFYLTFFYNISVCLSLWCLMVFFYATKKDLTSFRPLPKFLCVKAIIFFSFWQGVVVALLVFAGIIPESEHISVAIQDFLVCIEMVPFAIAHAFSFSYEDYFDQTVHSARMPIRKAISDSLGLKDVMMDTLDTLQGSRFSYRSFEPSEGVPHMGSSRTSRIMAGLRYSNMTTKKHWLEPAPTSRFLNSSGRGMNDEIQVEDDHEPLVFEDPQPTDDMEALYKASRKMVFGDYNYPVIDFRVPLWRLAREERRQQRQYGGLGRSDPLHKKKNDLIGPREGCIDVIIEQGKGNYVLVDTLNEEEEEQSNKSPLLPSPQPPPISPARNPTLTDVKRIQEQVAKNKEQLDKQRPPPVIVQPSHSTPQQQVSRYPQPQSSVSSSLFEPILQNASKTSVHQPASTNSMYQPPSEEEQNWRWPNEHTRNRYNEEELLTGDVWK
ncbi:organic solute transporter Ostalpha-domain-containing protein [Gilbertella persicaria]|uniref:organic solute transporter Ostalpha-domain-containing protein n=1 Tax=Gilbertella persicaria TaxID=101096 RepID=UPI00222054DF|nr:organic solute transporter Ostalpha-domain-containing protein [Gilbertella persicaria]KAI8087800.1 organic solute transporter Ostalpha-domain-containing protein [Gilbertella persicaria]